MSKKLLAASLIAASLIGATAAFAYVPDNAVIEGIIQSVDLARQTVTLTDGTTLTASPRLSIEPLQRGEFVRLMYRQGADGHPVLTAFWIDAGVGGEN